MKLLLLVPNKSNSYEIKIEVKGEDKKNDKKIRKMSGSPTLYAKNSVSLHVECIIANLKSLQ